MAGTRSPIHRERNFNDKEAHAFIAVLRRKANWRELDVTEIVSTWGVEPHRVQPLLDEADRLVQDIIKN